MSVRPRFSLLSLMLIAAFVCVSVSHWQTSKRSSTQEQTIRQLRDELGYLTVDDPNMAYARPVPTNEPFVWKFRVYLPPEKNWHLFTYFDGRTNSTLTAPTLHGQFTQTISLKHLDRRDEYVLSYRSSDRNGPQSTGTLDKDKGDRICDKEGELFHMFKNTLQHSQVEVSPDKPVALISQVQGTNNILQVYFSTDDPKVVMQAERQQEEEERQKAREQRRRTTK